MKICNKYYLSVEGETEKWYFEHLQDLINNNEVIDDYKEERNFKRILTKINLDNVITAVKNGNEIRKMNEENAEEKAGYAENLNIISTILI